ncbi:dihydrofolate reductase family protein [Kribbella italica]|uniref:Dihydrofolate reductase n=1 Tax=Kribbella italica TaxID=1540520 RepID=A0A7W9MTH4_9ACTN|nr:dihydrofolate reductase family protein [Kribbella italica]MBB5834918.1 dihydrofolate reductase [Kribbella italica]
MRSLIVFCSVTVDGFMAGPDNDLGFMIDDEELETTLNGELMRAADAIVVGRKSYPEMSSYWTTAEGELAEWMNGTPKHVLSSDDSYDVSAWSSAALAAGDGVEQVRKLKARKGKSIVVFGGVETVRALVAAGLVDEYWFKVHPVVVGRGRSMFFDLTGRSELKLSSVRSFPSGSLGVVYTA